MSEVIERFERNGYEVARFEDGNTAIKSPDGKIFSAEERAFSTTTLMEHFESQYKTPLQCILNLSDCIHHEDLVQQFRETILKHFVPRVLSPIQHIHHNKLSVKSLNFWNPLTPWPDSQTQFSRVCMDPQSAKVYGDLLKYKSTPLDGNNIAVKLKKFVPEIKAALDDGNPLIFSNAWDSLIITSESDLVITKTFEVRPVPKLGKEKNVAYRLLCQYGEDESPWAQPIMYALAVYVFSDFCLDPKGEQEAFYKIAGDQAESYIQGMYDHHTVNKDRFKNYEAENKYTTQNEISFDFSTPSISSKAESFTLNIELDQFKYPEQREKEAKKKLEKEKNK